MVTEQRPPNRLRILRRTLAAFVLTAAITAILVSAASLRQSPSSTQRPASSLTTAPDGPPHDVNQGSFESPAWTPSSQQTTRSAQSRSGRELARYWLATFLTRDSRDDDRWVVSLSTVSSQEVIDELRAAGPDGVGLTALSTWRVVKIRPIVLDDLPVDTPSRQVVAEAASVTDGIRVEQKPFVLYTYLERDGRWQVEQVDQPYSSEG